MKWTLKDLQEIQKGEHSIQKPRVFNIPSGPSKDTHREVGETWEELDQDGNVLYIWEQKKGYRVKKSPNLPDYKLTDDLHNYPNCYSDCELISTKAYSNLDEKFRKIYGMCANCSAKYETKLKLSGSWSAYERSRMLENAKSFFNELDDAIEQTAERIKKVEFVNESGRAETWSSGDQDERAAALKDEYNTYKTLILETLEGKRNDVVVK